MLNWHGEHLLKADGLSDKLQRCCPVRLPSRLVFNWHKMVTVDHNAVAAATQAMNLGSDVNRPVDLHATTTLMPYGVYTLMFQMAPGRVIVVCEVLLVMDDRPLARAVYSVLNLR